MESIKSTDPRKKLIVGLLFGFLILLSVMFIGDLNSVQLELLNFNWRYIPFVLSLTLTNYFLRFLKWHFYLNQIGAKEISWSMSARMFVAGFPLAVTPGKSGETLKGIWINQYSKISTAKGISVVVAERMSDGLAVLLLSSAGVIAYPVYWPVYIIVLSGLLLIMIGTQIRPLASKVLGYSQKLPFLKAVSVHMVEFYEGSFSLFQPRTNLISVGLGMVSWFMEGIGFFFVLIGLGIPATLHTFLIAIFTLSFSIIIGAASTLPGGIGAAEATIGGMLIYLLDIPTELAASATLLIRLCTLWFGVSLGLFVWGFSTEFLGINKKIIRVQND